MRATDTSSTRSPPSCSAEHRCSADAERSAAPFSGLAGVVGSEKWIAACRAAVRVDRRLTGVLLVSTIAIDRLAQRRGKGAVGRAPTATRFEGAFRREKQSSCRACAPPSWAARSSSRARTCGWCDRSIRRRAAPAEADGHCDDAEGEGRSVFRELPRRRRGGRGASSASISSGTARPGSMPLARTRWSKAGSPAAST